MISIQNACGSHFLTLKLSARFNAFRIIRIIPGRIDNTASLSIWQVRSLSDPGAPHGMGRSANKREIRQIVQIGTLNMLNLYISYLFLFVTSQVNSYCHGGTVSSPKHIFFLGKLEQAVNQYFLHILLLVTDNNASWMIQRKDRNYFMINLHKSMGLGWDPTRDLIWKQCRSKSDEASWHRSTLLTTLLAPTYFIWNPAI